MISGLKPYPAYKDSGLPWLGPVPQHWELMPNRTVLARRKMLVGDRHAEYRMLSLTKRGVVIRDVESGRGKFSADLGTSQEVHSGDLVFCLFDIPETPRTVGLSRHTGMITSAYTVFRCSDPILSAFLNLYYQALDDRKLLSPLYSGLRNTISPTRFLATRSPVPSTTEQSAIVRFLDHTDRRIRSYIRAKQKLIALVNEQKQVIIHRLVTRGAAHWTRFKSSEVEWLGEVPQHWEVQRAKTLFREIDIRSTTGNETLLSLRMHRGLVPHDQVSNLPIEPSALVGFKLVAPRQLVMNRMRAAIGMFGIANQPGLVSPDYAVLEPMGRVAPEYYLALFKTRAAGNVFRLESKGLGTGSSGFMRLYTDRFGIVKLPKPPLEEQHSIVAAIDSESAYLERAIDRAWREIHLLNEYRTRLIADVVTGKLDVREAAAQLPEEPEEPEPLGEGEATGGTSEIDGEDTELDSLFEEAET